jgi:hypothetical protein
MVIETNFNPAYKKDKKEVKYLFRTTKSIKIRFVPLESNY